MDSDNITKKDVKWMWNCIQSANNFSTCAKRQYFSILLDTKGHQIGSGWNGAPRGMKHCTDGGCPRYQEGSAPGSNYDNCVAIHAEANALLHSDYTARRDGGTLYVNGSCCYSCAKLIANSGIDRVVCIEDDTMEQWPQVRMFMQTAGLNVVTIPDHLLNEEAITNATL